MCCFPNCSLGNTVSIFYPITFNKHNLIVSQTDKVKLQTFFPSTNIVKRCLASCQPVQSPGPCQCRDLHSAQRRPETSKPLWSTTWCCTMGHVKKNNATQQRSKLLYPESTTSSKIKVGHISAIKQQNLMMYFNKHRTKVIALHYFSQIFLYFHSETFV